MIHKLNIKFTVNFTIRCGIIKSIIRSQKDIYLNWNSLYSYINNRDCHYTIEEMKMRKFYGTKPKNWNKLTTSAIKIIRDTFYFFYCKSRHQVKGRLLWFEVENLKLEISFLFLQFFIVLTFYFNPFDKMSTKTHPIWYLIRINDLMIIVALVYFPFSVDLREGDIINCNSQLFFCLLKSTYKK